jgi:hypothetical protein
MDNEKANQRFHSSFMEQDDVIIFDKKLVQRFALLSLDYALSPTNNSNTVAARTALSWSITNVDECSWDGVVFDKDDCVTKLLFGGRNLEGNMPSEIYMLGGLKHLDMANNMLSGPLPEELYDLFFYTSIHPSIQL